MKRFGVVFLSICVIMNCLTFPAYAYEEGEKPESEITVISENPEKSGPEENSGTVEKSEAVESSGKVENSETEESSGKVETPGQEETESEIPVEDPSAEVVTDEDVEDTDVEDTDVEDTDVVDTDIEDTDPEETELFSTGENTVWEEDVVLTQDVDIEGNLIAKGKVDTKGYALRVEGDMTAFDTVEVGNNGSLTVLRNYVQRQSDLKVGGSSAEVFILGDLRLCDYGQDNKEIKGSSSVVFANSRCEIGVGNTLFIYSDKNIGEGVFTLQGDLVVKAPVTMSSRIDFVGLHVQTIDIVKGTKLGELGGNNEQIDVRSCLSGTCSKDFQELTCSDGTLYIYDTFHVFGHSVKINGNVVCDGYLRVGEFGSLEITKDLSCAHMDLSKYGEKVTIGGDYRICGHDEDGREVPAPTPVDSYPDSTSVRNVGGDLYILSFGPLGYGTINLSGDLICPETQGPLVEVDAVINFVGTTLQTVDIFGGCRLGKLGGTNDLLKVKNYFNGNLQRNIEFECDEEKVRCNYPVELNGYTLFIPARVETFAPVDFGKDGKLIVGGDFYQVSNMDMSSGRTVLNVGGNYVISGLSKDGKESIGNGSVNTGVGESTAVRTVNGNIKVNTTGEFGGGTVNLGGDLVDPVGKEFSGVINFEGSGEQLIDIKENTHLGSLSGMNDNLKIKKYINGNFLKSFVFSTDEETVYVNFDTSLNSKVLVIPANLVVNADLTLGEGGKISVIGNYIQAAGSLNLIYGSELMDVAGDFKFIGLDEEGKEIKGDCTVNSWPDCSAVRNVGGDYVINTSGSPGYGKVNIMGNLLDKVGKTHATVCLIGEVSAQKKQTIELAEGGFINHLTLSSCGDFYVIPQGCYGELTKPEHRPGTAGHVIRPTTPAQQGEKDYLCTVCGAAVRGTIPRVQTVFSDVKTGDWFVNAVQYVYEYDIMGGSGDKFSPGSNLTREQFTRVLYNNEGTPEVTIENPYSDVEAGKWYTNSVLWVKEVGIAGGKADGSFGIGENISRQDLAKMLYEYARYKNFDLSREEGAIERFSDKGKVSGYAKNAMDWAVSQGVMSGKGGKLDPLGKATRAECASMIKNLLMKNAE